MQDTRRLCDEHGIVLIIDEVQTGLATTLFINWRKKAYEELYNNFSRRLRRAVCVCGDGRC